MARRFSARRYSQAVFNIALERQELERWQSDLNRIADLGKDDVVVALLQNPKLHFDIKSKLLSEQLGEVNPLALNLAYLLVSRGRLGMAGDIADEYQRLFDSYRGIEQAEVVTAVPLDDESKVRLGEHLGTLFGKKVCLSPR